MPRQRESEFLTGALGCLPQMIDPEKCESWLRAQFHRGDLPGCPDCGRKPEGKPARTIKAGGRIKCSACGKFFTWWKGTLFEGSRVNPVEFVVLRIALAAEMDHKSIAQLIGRSAQSVRQWSKKVLEFEEERKGFGHDLGQ